VIVRKVKAVGNSVFCQILNNRPVGFRADPAT
jgi:hypothetical protein